MTIGKAKEFIKRGMYDSDLRARLLEAKDSASLTSALGKEDLLFSDHDFDEAFHNLLTQCQLREQADQLKEFRLWWTMAVSLVQP
jgi:hypothetical protein